jgi:hypothetical protein
VTILDLISPHDKLFIKKQQVDLIFKGTDKPYQHPLLSRDPVAVAYKPVIDWIMQNCLIREDYTKRASARQMADFIKGFRYTLPVHPQVHQRVITGVNTIMSEDKPALGPDKPLISSPEQLAEWLMLPGK